MTVEIQLGTVKPDQVDYITFRPAGPRNFIFPRLSWPGNVQKRSLGSLASRKFLANFLGAFPGAKALGLEACLQVVLGSKFQRCLFWLFSRGQVLFEIFLSISRVKRFRKDDLHACRPIFFFRPIFHRVLGVVAFDCPQL